MTIKPRAIRLRENLTVTRGREIFLDPMIPGATNPTSPVLAASETGTRATILSASIDSISGRAFARVRIDRPGSSNHDRDVLVAVEKISDELARSEQVFCERCNWELSDDSGFDADSVLLCGECLGVR